MDCPKCEGWGAWPPFGDETGYHLCEFCDGTGELTEKTAQYLQRHDRMAAILAEIKRELGNWDIYPVKEIIKQIKHLVHIKTED